MIDSNNLGSEKIAVDFVNTSPLIENIGQMQKVKQQKQDIL